MSEYKIRLEWERDSKDFGYDSYTRDHRITFGPTSSVCASAAPEYHGNAECMNPEQSFLAALASCHMLTFLAIASKKKFMVDSYRDDAFAVLGRNEQRKRAIVRAVLVPTVTFSGENLPDAEQFNAMHEKAHDACFIANSIAKCVHVEVNAQKQQV